MATLEGRVFHACGTMKHMRDHRTKGKQRRSFTLSSQSVQFLQALHKRRRARSVSAVLDELLLKALKAEELRQLEAAVGAYYSAQSPDEEREGAAWGDFATTEFLRDTPANDGPSTKDVK